MKNKLCAHIYITPLCNLRCLHCYYDAISVGSGEIPMISAGDISSVVNMLCDQFRADVHIEGGETFLRTDISEIFNKIARRYYKYITVTTNGTVPIRLGQDVLKELGCLRVSVEGHTDELQQAVRGVSLSPVLKTISQWCDNNVPFKLRMTIHKMNYCHVQDAIDFYSDKGVQCLSFYEFQSVGRGSVYSNSLELSDNDFSTMAKSLKNLFISEKIKSLDFNFPLKRLVFFNGEQRLLEDKGLYLSMKEECLSVTVNYNGDVGIDPWDVTSKRTNDCFGNLSNIDLLDSLVNRAGCNCLAGVESRLTAFNVRYRVE